MSEWIALQIVRKPCAVISITFGSCLVLSIVFLYSWVIGLVELNIDTSPNSFVIRGDEVGDRHISFDMAREHSRPGGPVHLTIQSYIRNSSATAAVPQHPFHQYPILTIYYATSGPTSVLTPASIERMRFLETDIASRLEAHGLCRREDDLRSSPCEGFFSVASLLHSPQVVLPRHLDLDLHISNLRELLSYAGLSKRNLVQT